MGTRHLWIAGVSASALAAASPLHARAAQDQQPASDPSADSMALPGEIVVTAQKRAQKLQDVPLLIVALTTEALATRNVRNFNDYAKFLPSLSYSSYGPGRDEALDTNG